jgi:hypothetical protein
VYGYNVLDILCMQITVRAAHRPPPTVDELVGPDSLKRFNQHDDGEEDYCDNRSLACQGLTMYHTASTVLYSQVEGGRSKREAKIEALRYAQEVEELRGATFTPQRHTNKLWDKV